VHLYVLNSNRMRKLLYLFLWILPFATIAQEGSVLRSDSLVRVDGEDFLIHQIAPKQTLFSIAKEYGMTLSRLVFSNPGVLEGIQPGQFIRIPKTYLDENLKVKPIESLQADGEYVLYEVPSKMTLYSVAKEHNTTVIALMDANPTLVDGLKVGSTIRIPVARLISPEQKGGMEMERREAQVISEPAKIGPLASGAFNVSVLLDFYLNENDSIFTGQPQRKPEVYSRSEMALQFYEGLLIAVDSIRVLGIDVRLRVFDTQNSETRVQSIIEKGDLKGSDLIVGPFYSGTFKLVSAYAKELGVPLVSPTIQGNQIIQDNPVVFKIIPTEDQMMVALGKYLSKLKGTNNVVMHYGKPEEQALMWSFRKGLDSGTLGNRPSFPNVDASKGLRDSVFQRLSSTMPNHLVILTKQEARVASLARTVSTWGEKMNITVYGLSDWPDFRNVEMDYFDKMKLHVPEPFRVDYEDEATQRFILEFRNRYSTEPNTFAYRGFDIGIHFLRALPGIRKEGAAHMLKVKDRGLQSDFDWKQESGQGFENGSPRIVNYTGLKATFERP
jgi:LysM repeat protein/ABC-type branched-subunit amino acid transport system substrate-binding protein